MRTRGWETWILVLVLGSVSYEFFESTRWSNTSFFVDKDYQTIAARSLLDGHGLTVPFADPEDVSRTLYQPIAGWPPGYSLMVVPLLLISNDLILGPPLLEYFATLVFFGASWYVFSTIPHTVGLPARVVIFGWWFIAGSPFSKMGAGDSLAISFFTAGIAVTLLVFRKPGREVTFAALGAGLTAAAGCLRFAYWPLVVVVPGTLLFLAWRFPSQRRRLLATGIAALVVVAVALAALAAYQAGATAHATYLSQYYPDDARGFYLGQLRKVIPFPAGMLGLHEPFKNIVDGLQPPAALRYLGWGLLWALSIGVLWICGVQTWRAFQPASKPSDDRIVLERQFLFVATGLAMVLTVAMLLFLTLRMPALQHAPFFDGWVHGAERRYYVPAFLFLFIGLGSALTSWIGSATRRGQALVAGGLILLAIVPAALRVRRPLLYLDPNFSNRYEREWKEPLAFVRRQIGDLSKLDAPVVHVDAEPQRLRFGGLLGAHMLDPAKRKASWLQQHEKVSILVGLPHAAKDAESRQLRQELEELGGRKVGMIDQTDYWALKATKP